MIKAYICGPYRASTYEGIEANIQAAEAVARELVKMGYRHYCPHLNNQHFDGLQADEFFLKADMEWLEECDILVAIPGYERSSGSIAEIEKAKQIGVEVFYWPVDRERLATYGKGQTAKTRTD